MSDQHPPAPENGSRPSAPETPKPNRRRRPGPATFAVAAAASGFAFGAVVFGLARSGEASESQESGISRVDFQSALEARGVLRPARSEDGTRGGDDRDTPEERGFDDDRHDRDDYDAWLHGERDEHEREGEHEDEDDEDDDDDDDDYEEWMRHELEESESEWWELDPGALGADGDARFVEPRTSTRGS